MLKTRQVGIVDAVSAVRNGSDEVLYLNARVHLDFDGEFEGKYGGVVKAEWDYPMPVDSGINPGDLVAIEISFTSPFGRRFAPALDVGSDDGSTGS